MKLKTTSVLKKKYRLIKKLKDRFCEGTIEGEEDEKHGGRICLHHDGQVPDNST